MKSERERETERERDRETERETEREKQTDMNGKINFARKLLIVSSGVKNPLNGLRLFCISYWTDVILTFFIKSGLFLSTIFSNSYFPYYRRVNYMSMCVCTCRKRTISR